MGSACPWPAPALAKPIRRNWSCLWFRPRCFEAVADTDCPNISVSQKINLTWGIYFSLCLILRANLVQIGPNWFPFRAGDPSSPQVNGESEANHYISMNPSFNAANEALIQSCEFRSDQAPKQDFDKIFIHLTTKTASKAFSAFSTASRQESHLKASLSVFSTSSAMEHARSAL